VIGLVRRLVTGPAWLGSVATAWLALESVMNLCVNVSAFVAVLPCMAVSSPPPASVAELPTLPAPELSIEGTIGVPDGVETSWSALKGNVVILEFWGTDCAPCVAAIPHLNALVQKFSEKPVRFLAITKDDEATVKRFAGKRPVKGWIGLDPDGSTFEAYGARAIPYTVLVSARGRIVGVTSPSELTEAMIDELLAGHRPNLPLTRQVDSDPADSAAGVAQEPAPLFELTVRPSSLDYSSTAAQPTSFKAQGWFLKDMVAFVEDVPTTRVVVPEALQKQRYDVTVRWSVAKCDNARRLLAQTLGPALSIATHKEARVVDAYILHVPNTTALRSASTTRSDAKMRAGTAACRLWRHRKRPLAGKLALSY